jgi:hypothetical protein
LLVTGCTAAALPPPEAPAPTSKLTVAIHGPANVAYDPNSLGAAAHTVVLLVANPTHEAVPIGDVRVSYAARRNGVSVPCNENPEPRPRETHVIAAGERVSFVRILDCSMPFPGRYEVRVLASWSDAPLHEVGTLAVDVYDAAHRGPRPILDRPGLLGAIAGAQVADPTTGWEATIAVLNESAVVQPLGNIRVLLRSHPLGKSLWCTGPTTELAGPRMLAPGAMHVVHTRLPCDLRTAGSYMIQAELQIAGSAATEVGELQVRITDDPIELRPLSPPLP